MLGCPYCSRAMAESAPEHVFPRSIGGGLVLPAHASCNDRANREIDNHLVQCGHVRWARAAVSLRSPRGELYQEELLGTTEFMARPSGTSQDRDPRTAFQHGEDIGGTGPGCRSASHRGKSATPSSCPIQFLTLTAVSSHSPRRRRTSRQTARRALSRMRLSRLLRRAGESADTG
jgi:hypothetical protein